MFEVSGVFRFLNFLKLRIGRRCYPNYINRQPIEYIEYRCSRKDTINKIVAPLYEKGLSLRQIAQEAGIPKTSVRGALISQGIGLRPHTKLAATLPKKARAMRIGVPPYGFYWLRGRLVVDPKEIENVCLIIQLWQSRETFAVIVRRLNELKKKTRCGGKWDHSLVRNIILRHKNNPNKIEEVILWGSKNSSL